MCLPDMLSPLDITFNWKRRWTSKRRNFCVQHAGLDDKRAILSFGRRHKASRGSHWWWSNKLESSTQKLPLMIKMKTPRTMVQLSSSTSVAHILTINFVFRLLSFSLFHHLPGRNDAIANVTNALVLCGKWVICEVKILDAFSLVIAGATRTSPPSRGVKKCGI